MYLINTGLSFPILDLLNLPIFLDSVLSITSPCCITSEYIIPSVVAWFSVAVTTVKYSFNKASLAILFFFISFSNVFISKVRPLRLVNTAISFAARLANAGSDARPL